MTIGLKLLYISLYRPVPRTAGELERCVEGHGAFGLVSSVSATRSRTRPLDGDRDAARTRCSSLGLFKGTDLATDPIIGGQGCVTGCE